MLLRVGIERMLFVSIGGCVFFIFGIVGMCLIFDFRSICVCMRKYKNCNILDC